MKVKVLIKEQQEILLDILKYIDKVCTDNKIPYSLCGGTLIGAIRHGGFIPWDDDVDIFLTRDNYKKLINILQSSKKYKLMCIYNNEHHIYGFSKLVDTRTRFENKKIFECDEMGLFIDIFPLDFVPDKIKHQKEFHKSVNNKRKKAFIASRELYCYSNSARKTTIKRILFFPVHLILKSKGLNPLLIKADMEAQRYNSTPTETIGSLYSTYPLLENLPKEIYSQYIRVDFEEINVSVLKCYDQFLTAVYGNYMEMPPIEKQITHHPYEVYWRE